LRAGLELREEEVVGDLLEEFGDLFATGLVGVDDADTKESVAEMAVLSLFDRQLVRGLTELTRSRRRGKGVDGHAEGKDRALSTCALDVEISSEKTDQLGGDGKTKASAPKLTSGGPVFLFIGLEDTSDVGVLDADASVSDFEDKVVGVDLARGPLSIYSVGVSKGVED